MDLPVVEPTYDALVQQGLQLSESDFTTVTNTVRQGAADAASYLEATDDTWPQFLFSDSASVLGYAHQFDAINLPVRYLNVVAKNTTALAYKDQIVCSLQGKFLLVIKYTQWLRLLGREATVHHYQKKGNAKLHVSFPASLPEGISLASVLLSDIEVEARRTVDAISKQVGENPLWEQLDTYLQEQMGAYYNKPITELAELPRPELAIDYEMESIWPNVY